MKELKELKEGRHMLSGVGDTTIENYRGYEDTEVTPMCVFILRRSVKQCLNLNLWIYPLTIQSSLNMMEELCT